MMPCHDKPKTGEKQMTDRSFIAWTPDDVQKFWKELEGELKGMRDRMTYCFDRYDHLSESIRSDAEENAEHQEMLRLGLAIRNITVG
jgi:hypothetical protein